ncbi:hypothetical protein BKA70DRAFT_1225954 [Coprinopsis sp. MPI-PUGE-AT-0042]|nr:hypothetical protein BKA70DRAFT_1235301 [Coprinopsis sp. MPI-PUGE-AT-0042]KAH6905179.1 hypothetical protein BKA70DRAFT_1225954 [Coprinopsis sp. MPI-PUGE-AT-0042]
MEMLNAGSAALGQRDTFSAIVVDNFAGSLGDVRHDPIPVDRPSGTNTHGAWREPVSAVKPVSNSERRASRRVTCPRLNDEELLPYPMEEIIRRKNLIITHQRRKIRQLEERILEMNRLYLADQMQALVADVDSMHIDSY